MFFDFLTPKTIRNRPKSVGVVSRYVSRHFVGQSKNRIFHPLGPAGTHKMSRQRQKWPKMAIFDHFWPFLGFQMCGTPLKVFACVPETLGGYPLRRYHTTMGPGETFWETPGPIQGLRTGFPIGRPILASKIGLFKVILGVFGLFCVIFGHFQPFLAEFGWNII